MCARVRSFLIARTKCKLYRVPEERLLGQSLWLLRPTAPLGLVWQPDLARARHHRLVARLILINEAIVIYDARSDPYR